MKIQGFLKLTLLDYPERTACTVFTPGCNLRCPFCHNASLVMRSEENEDIPEEEVFSYLKKRCGILDGVCITGGEPMLQPDLEDFIRQIHSMGFLVKLDTNGTFPGRLKAFLDKGLLDYVAMDIKSSPEHYGLAAGVDGFDIQAVKESVSILKNSSISYEFRTTVVKGIHVMEDFTSIGKWLAGSEKYYLQSFVDSGDMISGGFAGFSREEMELLLQIVLPFVPETRLRGI